MIQDLNPGRFSYCGLELTVRPAQFTAIDFQVGTVGLYNRGSVRFFLVLSVVVVRTGNERSRRSYSWLYDRDGDSTYIITRALFKRMYVDI